MQRNVTPGHFIAHVPYYLSMERTLNRTSLFRYPHELLQCYLFTILLVLQGYGWGV
jgi:hypothetical protein